MRIELGKSSALVDSNILIYAFAEDSPKHEAALRLLRQCFSGNITLTISLQNIGEFCNIALWKYRLDLVVVRRIVQQILYCSSFVKISYRADEFEKALELFGKHNMEFWDAMLAATMLENGVSTIYTEDAAFGKIAGIKAVNPF